MLIKYLAPTQAEIFSELTEKESKQAKMSGMLALLVEGLNLEQAQ